MRKLLASSTFAIAGTLQALSNRLKEKLAQHEPKYTVAESLGEDYEGLEEVVEEWAEEESEESISALEISAIQNEISELDAFAELAFSIEQNAKGEALLKVLSVAFEKTAEYGGAKKAIIFTESRRTQEYLLKLLSKSEYWRRIRRTNSRTFDVFTRKVERYIVRYSRS
jgi:adenine-specific DNA-methyltransferase